MKISIIGSGNTATVLGKKMAAAGHSIIQITSRNEAHARQLASVFGCNHAADYVSMSKEADLYLLAISDDALTGAARQLELGHRMIVHTAGSVSKEILKPASTNYGVLYPLQSLRKELDHLPPIPFLVDSNTPAGLEKLTAFAKTISEEVQPAGDDLRLKLHLAAVIVNNFSNHLYALAEHYCIKEKADFRMLLPIIEETAARLQYASPKQLQTGPAIRQDHTTTQKHIALLASYPELKEIYELFTQSIQKM